MNKDGLETPSIYRLAISPKGMTSTLAAGMPTGIVFKKFYDEFLFRVKAKGVQTIRGIEQEQNVAKPVNG